MKEGDVKERDVLMRSGLTPLRITFMIAFLLFGVGCAAAPDVPEVAAITEADSAGVRIVQNHSPAWPDGVGWRVGEVETSIGVAAGAPEQQLFRVFDATRLSDGTVVIANSGTAELKFFDRDGNFIRSVGRAGGGPGEFSQASTIRALVRRPGDSLLTWDVYGQKLSLFDPAGEFVRDARLSISGRMYFWRGVFPDGTLLMALVNPDQPSEVQTGLLPRHIRLLSFSQTGDSLGVLGEYDESDWHMTRMERGAGLFMETPFAREVTLGVAGEGMVLSTGESYEYRVLDGEFSLVAVVRREFSPVPVREEDRARILDEELAGTPESRRPAVRRIVESLPLPEFFPPYKGMMVDAGLNVWLQEYPVRDGLPNDWTVFDPTGRWLGTVTLPERLEVYEIGLDYLLGKEVDDLGIERVRVCWLIREVVPGVREVVSGTP